jgi:hypothetical protein
MSNPLATKRVTKNSREVNPLMRPNKAPQTKANGPASPMHAHAMVWQGANNVAHDQLDDMVSKTDYATPILGKLASDPKVTGKDVIKALADAAADNQVSPSDAVKMIQEIPEKAEDVRPWLKSLYAFNMTAAVHLKAAAMRRDAGVASGMPIPATPGAQQPAAPGAISAPTPQPQVPGATP